MHAEAHAGAGRHRPARPRQRGRRRRRADRRRAPAGTPTVALDLHAGVGDLIVDRTPRRARLRHASDRELLEDGVLSATRPRSWRASRSRRSASCCCSTSRRRSQLRFDYAAPAMLATVGVVLLALGLARRDREPRCAATAPTALIGGVCAGLAARLGIDVRVRAGGLRRRRGGSAASPLVALRAGLGGAARARRAPALRLARRGARELEVAAGIGAARPRARCCCCAPGACGSATRSSGR